MAKRKKNLAYGRATMKLADSQGHSHTLNLHLGPFNFDLTWVNMPTAPAVGLSSTVQGMLNNLMGSGTLYGITSFYTSDWKVGSADIYLCHWDDTLKVQNPDTYLTTLDVTNATGSSASPMVLASEATFSFKCVDGHYAKIVLLDGSRPYPRPKTRSFSGLINIEQGLVSTVLQESQFGHLVSTGNAQLASFKTLSVVENERLAGHYGLR